VPHSSSRGSAAPSLSHEQRVRAGTSYPQLYFATQEGLFLKNPIATTLGLACIASLLSTSSAGAAVRLRPMDASVPTVYTETPAWSDTFVDSIGVDASYEDHVYSPLVTQWLEWSGIRHLRDSASISPTMISTFAALGAAGIKHSVGLGQGFAPSDLIARLTAYAPYVDFVEPANEADNVANPNWTQMKADQTSIWNIIHSNPAYSNIKVMGPSFANPLNGVHLAPLDAVEDYAQMHNATCDWNPGTNIVWVSIAANTAKVRESTFTKPIQTTETGYTDDLTRGCSLTDDIIAKYVTRTSTERWLAGESRTYFDFLVDTSNVEFGALGFLKSDGTPKPQMIAEGSLIHLLSDKGVAPAPFVTQYAITGATPSIHHIMFAKRDGSLYLALWQELPAWDHFGHKAIPIPPVPVTVTIPTNKSWVGLFQYNNNYSFTRTNLAVDQNNNTAVFPVTDSITVLHIYGRGRSAMMFH
jgi:hypothetical protein